MNNQEGRITFKPVSPLDHIALKNIAAAKEETLSSVVASAVNQWLVDNYKKQLNYYGRLKE